MLTLQRFNEERDQYIAETLERIKTLKDLLESKERQEVKFTLQEKKFMLTDFQSIEDVYYRNNSMFIVFKEQYAYLDGGSPREGDPRRIFYNLWKLGFIKYKISRATVQVNISSENNDIRYNLTTRYDINNRRNPHDDGLNCWGGWGTTLMALFNEGKFTEGIHNIVSRMKQFYITDMAASYTKLRNFDYERYLEVRLNEQETAFFKDSIIELLRLSARYETTTNRVDRVNGDYLTIGYHEVSEDWVRLDIKFIYDTPYSLYIPKSSYLEHIAMGVIRHD